MSKFRDRQARKRGAVTAYWLGLPAFFDRLWEWRGRDRRSDKASHAHD